jgi:hypothetical protein
VTGILPMLEEAPWSRNFELLLAQLSFMVMVLHSRAKA